jgi:hypothetical protein
MAEMTLLPRLETKFESVLYPQASSFAIGKFLQKTRVPSQNFKGVINSPI